ncbi:MAG: hypothetical protein RIS17_397 [Pseudomonadota bacterium]
MRVFNPTLALMCAAAMHAVPTSAAPPQQEDDAYTRYELLAPATHKFRIVYDVTATTPGATHYFNPIRPGSVASDEHVTDRASDRPLNFAEVDADVARAGGVVNAQSGTRYIAVTLARPVPTGGGARIRIDKTYEDAKTYRSEGDGIIFDRSLGIRRNAVVLPAGYRLVSSNVPAQILQQADGRIAVSFWNSTPAPMPVVIRAAPAGGAVPPSSQSALLSERASQTRNIVYSLRDPDSHSFDLTHDYTEERAGVADYVNIVRSGSTVANPSARDLDTGADLTFETVKGAAIAKYDPRARDLTPDTMAVVFHVPAVAKGTTRRIRIAETYTDPARYLRVGDELVWHRSFGRPANAVVLPAGWMLTNVSVPATVSETEEGRTRVDVINPRNDEIDVVITARRRN